MKIETLKISNFLTIGEIECGLDQKGLVLIQGENKDDSSQDSNGSGKSSFADAILWCLYGSTARGESGDKVVNRTAKKNCFVEILISDQDSQYKVTRHRKHPKEKNRLTVFRVDGKDPVDMTKGTDKLTQAVVDKIIGCSEDVFRAAIYAGQEAMPDLPGMTDKQLKTLIEEAAGIDRLQNAHSEAQSRIRATKSEIAVKQADVNGAKSLIADSEQSLLELKAKREAFIKASAEKIESLGVDLNKFQEQLDKVSQDRKVAEVKIAELNDALSKIQNHISSLDEEKHKQSELHKIFDEAKMDLLTSNANFEANEKKTLIQLKERHEKINDSLHEPCEACGKPVTEEDISVIAEKSKEALVKAKEAFVLAKNRIELKENVFNGAKLDLQEFEASMTDVSAELEKAQKIREVINKLSAHEVLEKEVTLKVSSIQSEINRLKSEENPYDDLIVSKKNSIIEKGKALAELKNDLERLENKQRVNELTEKVFSPAGVRAHILDTVTPFLNQRTSEYLSILTDENISATWSTLSQTASGDIREKFVIDVTSKVGANNFKSLSGGEKRKVRLACSMALQDLVSSRASKPIELYIADEIDHALDEAGLERLMGILDEKAKTKGTALVISHNSLSDWIRQSVTVVKENGYSTLKGTL